LRILLIPTSYPPVLGGLQTVVHDLARHLHTEHEVRVITNRYPRSLPAREVNDEIVVERTLFLSPKRTYLTHWRPDLFLSSLYYYPATKKHFVRVMNDFRPDVINVHFPDAQMAFVTALRRQFDFRLVVSLHGHDIERWCSSESPAVQEPGAKIGAQPLRDLLNEADAVTACSASLLSQARLLEPMVAAKGQVVYNGIDLKRFNRTTRYHHPRPYILSYGRFTATKGFDLLIAAFAKLVAGHAQVDLILAGAGEDETLLKKCVNEAELGDRVHFPGKVPPEVIVELLNGCLFLAVPSRSESFGIVALEGMAAGKPVVATNVGGLPEVLAGADALLVQPDNATELATALERIQVRLLSDPEFGARNRELAARFSTTRMTEGYLQAYRA
jgi:glycosyltransferase involved in cell wall biosynthesis